MLRVIDKVNNRVPKLSKLEWLAALGYFSLITSVIVGLTVIATDSLNFIIWDPRACAAAAVICVVLGSIKPRPNKLDETFTDRFAWATQYASLFLIFTVIGSLIFEADLREVGPLYSLGVHGYLFCSCIYIGHWLLQRISRNNSEGNLSPSQDFGVIPLYVASVLITSIGSFVFLNALANPDSYENCEGCEPIKVTDFAFFDVASEAFTHGLITVIACLALLLFCWLWIWTASSKHKTSLSSQNVLSLGLLIFSLLAVLSHRNTMPVMDDPLAVISRVFSMSVLLPILGLCYALILKYSRGFRVISAAILKRTPIPLVGTLILLLMFRDESVPTVIFGVIGLLLMLLFVFYLNDLENQILSRTEELREERAKSDALLENMLPGYVIDDLKQRGVSNPKTFPEISVMFTDFVGFTKIAQGMTPEALIDDLNKLFSGYDEIVEAHDSERIKTIGDAYMCASGLSASSSDSTANLVAVAHAMLKFTSEFNKAKGRDWQLRIGIAHGDCVGGVVGEKKYLFDLFGDVVNTAARMESHSEPGRINVDEATFLKASNEGSVEGERRPLEFVKGKGELQMYFLN